MRILLVTSRSPLPAWRGNQVRTVQWIEALAGHELSLVCPIPGDQSLASLPVESVPFRLGAVSRTVGLFRAALGGRPLQEGLYDTSAAATALAKALKDRPPDVAVVQMLRCGWACDTIRRSAPGTPIIFDAIDSMGLHFESAARSAPPPLSLGYRVEAARCRRRELHLATAATTSVAVSERDLETFSVPAKRGRVIPVAGREVDRPRSADIEPVVLLSGNLGYRPTVRSARWFAAKVWPRIHALVPGARWLLAGARPAPQIRKLERVPGVEVHADVPDLGSYLARSTAAIAPMSSGSGVPMKVLEAMAAGVPAVVHPWAAAGLVGEARTAVVEVSGANRWVEAIVSLLESPDAAIETGLRGRGMWERFYHPDRVASQIREVVEETAQINGRQSFDNAS